MEAAEAKVQRVLGRESTQFLVPHYQRPYSWTQEQWSTLWRDVLELLDDAESNPHFLGSVVTSPARSVPEGVEKRLLIDGQQRLTTLLVLLLVIRDHARRRELTKLAERIQDLVTNRHEDGNEHYRLLPTQSEDPQESDREAFIRIVNGSQQETRSGIGAVYRFFDEKLRRADAPDPEELLRIVIMRLTLVSIVLDEDDNPHRIFESLNAKGRPLAQADLIRNYFFMRLPEKEHERAYVELWRPMQRRLGEDALTDFVRHYLTRFGTTIRETDVYSSLKARVEADRTGSPMGHLQELCRFSEYYEILLAPEKAATPRLRERLGRLNRLEVTVAYPFLLAAYADFQSGARSEEEIVKVLDAVENFLVRRFVVGIPTNGLNKIFVSLYEQGVRRGGDFVANIAHLLSANTRAFPRDDEFRQRFRSARLYGGGDRRDKTKYILERLELGIGHKEAVAPQALTIEHVMPQTLTEHWKTDLGPDWEEDHEALLHTIGNLTLTSYNTELGNAPFAEKKKLFGESHVDLNRYFVGVDGWSADEIERRAEALSEQAVAIWPYFGPVQTSTLLDVGDEVPVARTSPKLVRMRGRDRPVVSWVDVAVATAEGIVAIGEDEFRRIVEELPKFVNTDPTGFRRSSRLRKLSNGAYVETNLSAPTIYRLCLQSAALAGLGPDEWSVEYAESRRADDEPEASDDARSPIQELRRSFWQRVRDALLESHAFPSVRPARGSAWLDLAMGRAGVWMSLRTCMSEGRVEVRLTASGDVVDRVMQALLAERGEIERTIGQSLEWAVVAEERNKFVRASRDAELLDPSQWPIAVQWLTTTAVAFRTTFGPRIAKLDLRTIRRAGARDEGSPSPE